MGACGLGRVFGGVVVLVLGFAMDGINFLERGDYWWGEQWDGEMALARVLVPYYSPC